MIILGIISSFCIFSSNWPQSNLEKFNAIDVDLQQVGIDKSSLQSQFKKDPVACRQFVEHHKRKRFMLVSKVHEQNIGRHFVNKMTKMELLWHDAKAQARCNKILARLAKVMPEHFSPPQQIYILDTPEINACCLPDGTIVVFRGLLNKFNDDELAWVIAHELGHGVAHHSAEMLSKAIIQELAIDSFVDKDSGLLKIAGTHIAAFITNLRYSRTQENEADRLGLLYMNKAHFNLQGAVTALEKFKSETGEKSEWAEWLSTHPHPEKRLSNVLISIRNIEENPDYVWGGVKDTLVEKAKIKAIEYYLKQRQKQQKQLSKEIRRKGER